MIRTFSSTIRRREMDAVLTCMVDEKIGPGELNAKLIQTVRETLGCAGAVAFRSPDIALSYALRALAPEAGSRVMLSALAPAWQYGTVTALGLTPLVLDVDEETGLVAPAAVEAGAQAGGRILVLHESMGILPELGEIAALGIPVIEDISQSFGAELLEEAAPDGETPAGQGAVRRAGMTGVFSILGLEEFDTITAGGGAVLIAPAHRDWIALKKLTDEAPRTDILPDINSALAFVQLKEFKRNEQVRKELFAAFQHALLSGKNRTFARAPGGASTVWSFPVVLAGSQKDVKQYASRKEIEVLSAYDGSVIAAHGEELSAECPHAKALSLRCVLFPLYPRLGAATANKIAKVLGSLP